MLRTLSDFTDYSIGATDGTIGLVKDFYFDDQTWVVRYLVVETGTWLSSRKVLISPVAILDTNRTTRLMSASITMQQVKDSPNINTDIPVSRQHEMTFLGFYDYPLYWADYATSGHNWDCNISLSGFGRGGTSSSYREAIVENVRLNIAAGGERQKHDDQHLRSSKVVMSYHVHATDGDIGHVSGFLVDEETWAIRYVIVDTSNWWIGHRVLIAPEWISSVRWAGLEISVELTRDAVRRSPPYQAECQLDRDKELGIYRHYKRAGYWVDDPLG
jgi:hypothetical protein